VSKTDHNPSLLLMIPALMCAPLIIGGVLAVGSAIVANNILSGSLSRAGAKWVDEQEREAFKDSIDEIEPRSNPTLRGECFRL
jgi:hypothetical protein